MIKYYSFFPLFQSIFVRSCVQISLFPAYFPTFLFFLFFRSCVLNQSKKENTQIFVSRFIGSFGKQINLIKSKEEVVLLSSATTIWRVEVGLGGLCLYQSSLEGEGRSFLLLFLSCTCLLVVESACPVFLLCVVFFCLYWNGRSCLIYSKRGSPLLFVCCVTISPSVFFTYIQLFHILAVLIFLVHRFSLS